jgi:hypothetical protein
MIKEWDIDENGDIIVYPLFGYNTAMIAEMTLLIRFDCAKSKDDLEQGTTHRFQMTMTTEQCRMFAQDLLNSADMVEAQGQFALQ